ncbi:unnamed protein product [Lasius platythorax]|uniref:Uncharacterized protein n=1 Tax=Lasius platythorax TaxID=488582 RepID=A0AAV2NNQ2_9HYME
MFQCAKSARARSVCKDSFQEFRKIFITLKDEFLPYILVSKQLFRPKQSVDDRNISMVQEDVKEDIFQFAAEKPLDELIREMSAFNDYNADLDDAYYGNIIRLVRNV